MNIPVHYIPSWYEVAVWRDERIPLDADTARDWWNDVNEPEYGDTY